MKMFFMIYDVDYDEDVMEMLSTCCVVGFTKWSRVLGRGERSDPKLDNPVWPGFNCAIMVAVDDITEPILYNAMNSLLKNLGGGLRVFEWPLEKII